MGTTSAAPESPLLAGLFGAPTSPEAAISASPHRCLRAEPPLRCTARRLIATGCSLGPDARESFGSGATVRTSSDRARGNARRHRKPRVSYVCGNAHRRGPVRTRMVLTATCAANCASVPRGKWVPESAFASTGKAVATSPRCASCLSMDAFGLALRCDRDLARDRQRSDRQTRRSPLVTRRSTAGARWTRRR